MRARGAEFALTCRAAPQFYNRFGRAACRELKPDLPAARELDIDLGKQFGIEQRAVKSTVAAVDSVTRAKRIQRKLGAIEKKAGK